MKLNDTPSSNRIHITLYGKRNTGKSSLINAICNQSVSTVSNVAGTTTDTVAKSMELLPIGPVTIYDTPGYDDEGELGDLRIAATKRAILHTDIAILVIDSTINIDDADRDFEKLLRQKNIPVIVVYNKSDLLEYMKTDDNRLYVSATNNFGIDLLKQKIIEIAGNAKTSKQLVGDLICEGDIVLLVIPIDEAAPKGRLILPQQQVMRDILDSNCSFITCKETQLKETLSNLCKKPKLVITDSQVFEYVSKQLPADIPLTSFSILFARYKGNFEVLLNGAEKLDELNNGDTILISEACTHHRQCGDIGSVKLPKWISEYSGKNLNFEFSSGNDFPNDLSKYQLVVHCGGCMINQRQMNNRIEQAINNEIPIVNYGIAIAKLKGILDRAVKAL